MKKQWFMLFVFVLSLTTSLFFSPKSIAATDTLPPSKLIITEIKLGGESRSADPKEFVSIFNLTNQDISLADWKLQYAKAEASKTSCEQLSWSDTDTTNIVVPAKATKSIERSLTDTADGSLRLIDSAETLRDLVGWGSSSCFETSPTVRPSSGKSIKRYKDCDSWPIDTDNNLANFAHNQAPSPGSFISVFKSACGVTEPPEPEEPPVPLVTCEGVIINEILPNPAGSDVGREFVELYNPTDEVISLKDCALQTSASTKKYTFANVSLQPSAYFIVGDDLSGLTLPNSSGGSVWLLSPSEELQAITYPGNLEDDQAWALFGASWQTTYKPTPAKSNILLAQKPCPAGEQRSSETGQCRKPAIGGGNDRAPCRADQERNPETNRCRLIQTAAAGLIACKPGQERNPETNRCRSILGATSTLTPCKPGQERNPATNRCRSAGASGSELKPCAEGQARNPETNRCRKVAGSQSDAIAQVKEDAGNSVGNNSRWMLAGLGVAGALGYAGYEWRREAWGFLSKLKK